MSRVTQKSTRILAKDAGIMDKILLCRKQHGLLSSRGQAVFEPIWSALFRTESAKSYSTYPLTVRSSCIAQQMQPNCFGFFNRMDWKMRYSAEGFLSGFSKSMRGLTEHKIIEYS